MRKFSFYKTIFSSIPAVIVLLSLHMQSPALAQSQYELSWYTIDGGGGTSNGGPYVLTGTIGQPDAAYSSGSNYELLGGFWPGGPLCFVEFEDFARFALYWMQWGEGLPADLYPDNYINTSDLFEFVNWWLCYCPYNWPLK